MSPGSALPADPWLVLAVLAVEAALGYPAPLNRVVPHPVVWAGTAIGRMERMFNRPCWPAMVRRILGVVTVLGVAGAAGILGWAMMGLAGQGGWLLLLVILIASAGLAQRSLYQHVRRVEVALAARNLPAARQAVSMIVGRDVAALEPGGVAAAALESLAESFNDGIVAPVFWLFAGGIAGLFAYKAVNTADSMIGHWEPRWRAFGWASARLDDLMNFVPARLAGGLLALAGGAGWSVMARDAGAHTSPNAGWPEAAMAGALGVRLGGPAVYDGEAVQRPWFGDGTVPAAIDVQRGLRVYVRACGILWGIFALGGLLWRR